MKMLLVLALLSGFVPAVASARNTVLPPPNTVVVDYSQTGGAFPTAVYQHASTIQVTNGSQYDDQLMADLGVQITRTFYAPAVWAANGPGNYTFCCNTGGKFGDDEMLDDIVASGSSIMVCITSVPSWLDNGSGLPNDPGNYIQMIRDGLNHLLATYSGTIYVEAWNEPDITIGMDNAETLYGYLVTAVQSSDAPSRFRVGGPTVATIHDNSLPPFLNYVASNDLQFDFVSYHTYGNFGDNIDTDSILVKNALSSAGLDPNLRNS